ncbi:MAG TPA: ATP-dependent helicase C-terminal domain-containing protein, partial [Chthoniobacterales bacterium]|nr:ATP-dependent helicase C-terminal domain-containing protein [Chthoniobacterales bacterium]
LFPESFREEASVEFDPTLRRVVGRRATLFHDLVLRSEEFSPKADPRTAELLAREVAAGNCPLKNWDNSVQQWIHRVNFVATNFAELQFPGLDEAATLLLLGQICHDATSYKEVKDRPVWPIVKAWLNNAQQQLLDELAPERIKLTGGGSVKILYGDGTPTIAARIQDLYDTPRGLSIGRGRIPLRIQVLAPNRRPIQITTDLETFWRESYPKIKKELQRKYPKHQWR